MTPLVSILVPVYRVSAYIERCAHSLFGQTFQDVEYVFVDDATPDDSMEKLAKVVACYPHRKEQVKIVHHSVNKGLACARNTAVAHACGVYLLQVDSDDYVEIDMVELLYHKAIETEADIVVCDFYRVCKGVQNVVTDAVYDDPDKNRSSIIASVQSCACVWNKLIKRDLYNKCHRLPLGMDYCEDRFIVVQLYFLTGKIAKINTPLYHYTTTNAASITAQHRTRKHFENTFQCWDFLSAFLLEQGASEAEVNLLALEKIKRKASLMIATNSTSLRKAYASVWHEEETKYLPMLTRGKRVILELVRRRWFGLAQMYHYGVVTGNRLFC